LIAEKRGCFSLHNYLCSEKNYCGKAYMVKF
jgi:hypothetical protein